MSQPQSFSDHVAGRLLRRLCCALALWPLTLLAQEAIDLESTFVGDREQPAVSYFIPWKAPEGPDKLYRPIKSIASNVLDPIDRDVLNRTIHFYDELALEQRVGRD